MLNISGNALEAIDPALCAGTAPALPANISLSCAGNAFCNPPADAVEPSVPLCFLGVCGASCGLPRVANTGTAIGGASFGGAVLPPQPGAGAATTTAAACARACLAQAQCVAFLFNFTSPPRCTLRSSVLAASPAPGSASYFRAVPQFAGPAINASFAFAANTDLFELRGESALNDCGELCSVFSCQGFVYNTTARSCTAALSMMPGSTYGDAPLLLATVGGAAASGQPGGPLLLSYAKSSASQPPQSPLPPIPPMPPAAPPLPPTPPHPPPFPPIAAGAVLVRSAADIKSAMQTHSGTGPLHLVIGTFLPAGGARRRLAAVTQQLDVLFAGEARRNPRSLQAPRGQVATGRILAPYLLSPSPRRSF